MFLLPGISALFTFIYLRPQEVFDLLRAVTMAWMVALVTVTWVLDVRVGATRPRVSALTVLALVLFAYCLATVAIKAPDRMAKQVIALVPSLIAFFFVSQGLQTLRGLGSAATVLLVLTLVVSAIGVDQGAASPICYMYSDVDPAADDTSDGEVVDGRPCTTVQQCLEGGQPEREYLCERPGIFDTHSIGRRVRFRGLLEDPNELSWAIAMALPLAFALYERRRSMPRLGLLITALAVGGTCVVMSKSRSGQLSVAGVLAVYFIRRFGWRGAVAGALASLPIFFLGGRSGADAESSSEERLGCWAEALSMWRENPLIGVGQGQFTEHHYLTAHNSFMLTVAELGPLGLLLWSAVLYLALKITVRIQVDLAGNPAAAPARIWALALLSSMVGMLVSAFFLSIAYHTILWTFLGLVGALEGTVRAHDPNWRVRFGWRDLVLVAMADTAIVAAVSVYLRLKGV